ncbi:PLP-dependent transferase [Mycena vulgaris]|nr:PLP-dependent transferase [Mycena vulgaris]
MGSVSSTHPIIIRRKRSARFTRVTFPCTAGTSFDSSLDPSHDTHSLCNEKSRYIDQEEPPEKPHHISFATYAPAQDNISGAATIAYQEFLSTFPVTEYRLTWIIDTLRRSDYGRLETTGETYVDYMGGAIYPESLIRVHTEFLNRSILGNTHSVSNSSKLSLKCADDARAAVLSFFRASADEYTVIFTPNATGALKLVGESYPFTGGGSYNILLRNRPRSKDSAPCLFALTAQSNISNTKNSLSIIEYAASLGYHTLLDAAALAATSTISLSDCRADAMAVSFYKMFGFPTGVGALVVKKSFLMQLKRPWFAGGTVDVVQVPGRIVTRSHELHEQFEDGTINYLTLPAVTDGLRFLSAYLPFLPLRLSCLMHYLVSSLSKLRHDTSGAPAIRILSATPSRRLKSPTGEMLPNSFIEYSASKLNVSLRTGCMCNPGGAAAILGIQGRHAGPFERAVGHELGVVRVSLGLASNFQDAWTFATRTVLWDNYVDASGIGIGQAI